MTRELEVQRFEPVLGAEVHGNAQQYSAALHGLVLAAPIPDEHKEALLGTLLGVSTPDLVMKTYDTYPPVVAALTQNYQIVDLTNMTSVKFLMKGVVQTLQTGTAAKLTVASPTGTFTQNSNVIQSVSSFTNVVQGASLIAPGYLPAPSATQPVPRVSTFDSVAGTITVTDNQGNPINATAGGSTITVTVGKGCVTYTLTSTNSSVADTCSVEWEITWSGGGVQTFPNSTYGAIQFVADLEGS